MHMKSLIVLFIPFIFHTINSFTLSNFKTICPDVDTIISSRSKDTILNKQSALLHFFLLKYAQLKMIEKWDPIPIPKKSIRNIDTSFIIGLVRRRLFLLEDLKFDNKKNDFDNDLIVGINQFQKRNGLESKAIIDQTLIRKLNTPIDKIINKIKANIIEWNASPKDSKNEHIVINIPDFKLFVIRNDSCIMDMKVIVGKSKNKTPLLESEIEYVVLSPYWNIPTSILEKEIAPLLKKYPNYLQVHHMEWNGKMLRQMPGSDNALGGIKFVFENPYHVYLHDTPVKSLFQKSIRALSHGCIRIEQPKKLALYLLRNDRNWNEVKIDRGIQSGKEMYIKLLSTIPIKTCYFTTWVNEWGKLEIREDIYNRENVQ